MAHSTAPATAGEINYYVQDGSGKILKVLKREDIKQETLGTTTSSTAVYAATATSANSSATNIGAYNQMSTSNQPQFVRIQNNYNIQTADNTTYTVIASQSSSNNMPQPQQTTYTTIKYEPSDTQSVKSEERYTKYTQNANTKTKSKLHTTSSTHSSVQRKRKSDKAGKGLRHFSMKVCEKVKEKGITTYNEVADELVNEELQHNSIGSANCDQKNIRRRVYDALNVLMAMEIISKDKKEIKWKGLPSNSLEQCSALEKENEERRERINQKHQQLRELLLQQVAFKSLIERNKEAERQGIIPPPNSSIQLPFIIVNTHKSTKINCSVTNDKSEYIFRFDDNFEMHDDAEVLKRMGLLYGLDKGQCSYEHIERAKSLVPPNFEKYIEAYGKGKVVNCDSDDEFQTYELTNDSQGFLRTVDVLKSDLDDDDDEYLDNSDID